MHEQPRIFPRQLSQEEAGACLMGLKAFELSPDPSPEFLINVISQSGQGRTTVPSIVGNPSPKEWIELFGYFGQRPVQGRLADGDALGGESVAKFEHGAVPVVRKPGYDPIGVGLGLAGIAVATEWAGLHVTLPDLEVSPTAHARGAWRRAMGCAGGNGGKHTGTFDISADLHRQIA